MRIKNTIIPALVLACASAVETSAQTRAAQPAKTAPAKRLSFKNTIEIAPLMFSVPAPFDIKGVPQKPSVEKQWNWSDGRVEIRVAVTDLWLENQLIGEWIDSDNNKFRIAKITHKFPDTPNAQPDVTRDEFQRAIENAGMALGKNTTPADLAAWMSRFGGVNATAPTEPLKIGNQKSERLLEFETGNTRVKAFAFTLKPAQAPQNWFALVVSLAAPPDEAALKNIRDELLPGIGAPLQRNVAVRKNRTNPNMRVPASASRERAKNNIGFLADWWFKETPNYILLSNSTRSEPVANNILNDLECLNQTLAKIVPPFANSSDMTGFVRFFETETDYKTYMMDAEGGGAIEFGVENTSGVFSPMLREFTIRPTSHAAESQDEYSFRSTVKHEGTHQYLHTAFGGAQPARWYDEGMATVFGSSVFDNRGAATIKESPSRVKIVEAAINDKNSDWPAIIRALTAMDHRQFYSQDGYKTNYALAWGFMYYLLMGAPLEPGEPFKNFLPAYRAELERTRDNAKATAAAFDSIGPDGLEKLAAAFVKFWKPMGNRPKALQQQKWK